MITKNKVVGISYGKNPQSNCYYVQTFCNKCHTDKVCSCLSIAENLTRVNAKEVSSNLSKLLDVPVEVWHI